MLCSHRRRSLEEGKRGVSERCDEHGIWTSLVISVSPMATHCPVDHPKPAAELPPKNERGSVQGIGQDTTEMRLPIALRAILPTVGCSEPCQHAGHNDCACVWCRQTRAITSIAVPVSELW